MRSQQTAITQNRRAFMQSETAILENIRLALEHIRRNFTFIQTNATQQQQHQQPNQRITITWSEFQQPHSWHECVTFRDRIANTEPKQPIKKQQQHTFTISSSIKPEGIPYVHITMATLQKRTCAPGFFFLSLGWLLCALVVRAFVARPPPTLSTQSQWSGKLFVGIH